MEHTANEEEPGRTCVTEALIARGHSYASAAMCFGRKVSTAAAPAIQRQSSDEVAAPSGQAAGEAVAAKDAVTFPLNSLPSDLLQQVLLLIGSAELLRLSQVSATFAKACEECFTLQCQEQGWRFPRIPRDATAGHKCFPWRALYRRHACRACGGIGVFPCRHGLGVMRGNSCLFLICKRCSQQELVQQRLVQDGLHVDLFGVNGQKLLPARRKGVAKQRHCS